MRISSFAALVAAVVAAAAPTALAAPAPTPIITCAAPKAGGGFTGYWGYSNPGDAGAIPVGRTAPVNYFTGTGLADNQGQPTAFAANTPVQTGFGDTRTYFAAAVDFATDAVWHLNGATSAFASGTPACDFNVGGGGFHPDRAVVRPGQTVSWDVQVVNEGDSPLPVGQIQMTPSAGTTLTPPTTPDELLAGESFTVKARTPVTAANCFGTASATVQLAIGPGIVRTPESDTSDNTLRNAIPVDCAVDLQVRASADGVSYKPGQTATYTVQVTNAGEAVVPVSQIQVANTRTENLAPVGTPPANLAPGETITYRGSSAVTTQQCGLLGSVASVAIADPARVLVDSRTENDTWTTTVAVDCTGGTGSGDGTGTGTPTPTGTSLGLTVAGPSRIRNGARGVYRMTVRNTGTQTARAVVVALTLPRNVILAQVLKAGEVRTGSTVWRRIPALAAGKSWTTTLRVRYAAGRRGTRSVLVRADAANTEVVKAVRVTRVR